MPYPKLRDFDPNTPKIARREFRVAGHQFTPGEPFPWRRMALPIRRVRQMFESGRIEDAKAVVFAEPDPAPSATKSPEDFDEVEAQDGDLPDNMKELRFLAEIEGAPLKRSIAAQKRAILDNRAHG